MDIRQEILKKLHETEKEKEIKIIYAIESGSRGWGFASPDSDFDCRFIYVHKKDWYLSIEDKMDFIDYPVNEVFDINGWDVKKTLKLLRKSNPVIIEWLSSPIIYVKNDKLIDLLQKLSKEYFNPVHSIYHYLSMAKNNFSAIKETSKLKKYFYVLRPLACCQFILEHNDIPPMEYAKVLKNISLDKVIINEISQLLEIKKRVEEDYTVEKNIILFDYFEKTISICEEQIKKLNQSNNKNSEPLNDYFRKTINEAWL